MSSNHKSAGGRAATDSAAQSGQPPVDGASPSMPGNWPLRLRLALVASWEIEALTDLLIRDQGDEFEQEARAARAVLQRVRDLGRCVLAALDDEREDPVALRRRMFPDSDGDFGDLIGGAA